MKTPSILIVDDESDVIQALRYRLETGGYSISTASDGKQALAQLESNTFDLVLTDFMMPELNGLELADHVRQRPEWSNTKLLMFSCHTEPEVRARARELGVLDYLAKTDGASAIVRRVYETLNAPLKPSQGSQSDEALGEPVREPSEPASQAENLAFPGRDQPPQTEYSYGDSESLAEDLRRLALGVDAGGG